MERGAVFMLSSFPVSLLAGVVLGFLSGLGTGGGSLLLLWLTMVVGMPQQDARMVNLLFTCPQPSSRFCCEKSRGCCLSGPCFPVWLRAVPPHFYSPGWEISWMPPF